ncbi:MAG: hypothetical protein ACAI34_10665 [Verrucomicrobium sp.]|nr:hypothetical protein [Verrucomicrobium sp.]
MKTLCAVTICLLTCHLQVGGAELTPEQLEHGKRQVEKMLTDRPGMAVYHEKKDGKEVQLTEGDAIYRWAVKAYAGRYVGEPVFWDGDAPAARAGGKSSQSDDSRTVFGAGSPRNRKT